MHDLQHLVLIDMNVSGNNQESLANSSRSVFVSCPNNPLFIWDLKQTLSLQLSIAVTTIACPIIIVLNALVIVAVKKFKKLQTNSNILLASLACVDLIVGTVSLPLTILLDTLILHGTVSEEKICAIDRIAGFVLYSTFNASFYHLILIAKERYAAVVKYAEYKVMVSKVRIKNYVAFPWITTLSTAAIFATLVGAGVPYSVSQILVFILIILWIIGFLVIGYCYLRINVQIQKRLRRRHTRENVSVHAAAENKISYTMLLLTVAILISGVPSIIVFFFASSTSSFRTISANRWAELILQLNSLLDPVLYFYRNVRYRKVALELMGCAMSQETQEESGVKRRERRRRNSVPSIVLNELMECKPSPNLPELRNDGLRMSGIHAESAPPSTYCDNLRDKFQFTELKFGDNLRESVTRSGRDILHDARGNNTLTVMAKIESAP